MNYGLLTTEILTASLGLLLLIVGLIASKNESRRAVGYLAIFGLAGIFAYTCFLYGTNDSAIGGMFVVDNYAVFFKQLFLAAAILTLLFSLDFVDRLPKYQTEYYAMIVFALLGMEAMASGRDLATIYVAMELMTITFFILVAYVLGNGKSSEAGMKYIILGAASSAVMLYGISLIYGTAGSLVLPEILQNLGQNPAVLVGTLFILVGFAFKVSAVPFHMWSPDIYEGAPAPITAYLAMASKAAGFAALVRVFLEAFPNGPAQWHLVVGLLAALSIIIGNLVAIPQTNVKRMLAYSSVAQAGYILVGLLAGTPDGIQGVLFYLMIYVFANVGAFAVVTAVEKHTGSSEIADYAGLAQKAPVLAFVLTAAMLSMAGIPPLAGFTGKLYLFKAAMDQGQSWIAFIGFILSMISVYYYLMVSLVMYRDEPKDDRPMELGGALKWALYVSAIATLFFGVYPGPLAELASLAARSVFGL